jgi:hypothetical protein
MSCSTALAACHMCNAVATPSCPANGDANRLLCAQLPQFKAKQAHPVLRGSAASQPRACCCACPGACIARSYLCALLAQVHGPWRALDEHPLLARMNVIPGHAATRRYVLLERHTSNLLTYLPTQPACKILANSVKDACSCLRRWPTSNSGRHQYSAASALHSCLAVP